MEKVKQTIDHNEIVDYVTRQHGNPCYVTGTKILRIKFATGYSEQFIKIAWEEFFKTFEKSKLLFLYNPHTKFNKFIKRI